jgi:hypothetical protein
VRGSAAGLSVAPGGTAAGGPAFTATCGPDAPGGGRADHVKWAALTPAFDVPRRDALELTVQTAVRCHGTARHPFGAAVADPATDVRLAAGCVVATDPASRTAFDFALTDRRVYALYERLPGTAGGGFTYAVPVAARTPGQWHRCRLRADRGGTRVTWLLDGEAVLCVDRVGQRLPSRAHLVIDHGGPEEPEPLRLRRLTFGLGLLTLLDAAGHDGRGLVRLDAAPGFYRSVRDGSVAPQAFVDERSLPGSRLWGAGAVLRARQLAVARRKVLTAVSGAD